MTARQLIEPAACVTHAGIANIGDKATVRVWIMEACRGLSSTALVLTVARSFWCYKVEIYLRFFFAKNIRKYAHSIILSFIKSSHLFYDVSFR